MIKKVKAFIAENRLLENGDAVIVALSGGMDSVTLLHILYSLKELYNLKLYAAHLNHGIRGEEADRDEAFVRELCESLGVPLYLRRADIPAMAAESGKSEELCGREARYAFFGELAAESGAKIATAHNRDDHAETVLWNLIRGAGLCCSRSEIEAYQAEHNLSYVTDSTNLEPLYTRNRIRLEIMPLLKALNENADGNIARTSGLLREADDYLTQISEIELKECRIADGYDCRRLLRMHPAIRGYVLRQIADAADAPMDCTHAALVTQAMRDGGAVDLGGGMTAVCAQGILRIIGDDADSDVVISLPLRDYPGAVRVQIIGGEIFCGGKAIPRQKINSLFVNNLIPCDIITDDTIIRARREGDTFSDSRRGVTKTLKKLFNEMRIPREKRSKVRLIADGSRVLWIEGIGSAEKVDLSRDQEVIYLEDINTVDQHQKSERSYP